MASSDKNETPNQSKKLKSSLEKEGTPPVERSRGDVAEVGNSVKEEKSDIAVKEEEKEGSPSVESRGDVAEVGNSVKEEKSDIAVKEEPTDIYTVVTGEVRGGTLPQNSDQLALALLGATGPVQVQIKKRPHPREVEALQLSRGIIEDRSLQTPSPPIFNAEPGIEDRFRRGRGRFFVSVDCHKKNETDTDKKCDCATLMRGLGYPGKSAGNCTLNGADYSHIPYAKNGYCGKNLDNDIYSLCTQHNLISCIEWQLGIYIPFLGHVIFLKMDYSGDVSAFIESFRAMCEKFFLLNARDTPFSCTVKEGNLYLSNGAKIFIDRCIRQFASEWPKLNIRLDGKIKHCPLHFKEKLLYSEMSASKVISGYESNVLIKEDEMPIYPNCELFLYKCIVPVCSELLYSYVYIIK